EPHPLIRDLLDIDDDPVAVLAAGGEGGEDEEGRLRDRALAHERQYISMNAICQQTKPGTPAFRHRPMRQLERIQLRSWRALGSALRMFQASVGQYTRVCIETRVPLAREGVAYIRVGL